MVRTSPKTALTLLHSGGAVASTFVLAMGLWFGVFSPVRAGTKLASAQQLGRARATSLRALEIALRDQQDQLEVHRSTARQARSLPTNASVEEYLASITHMARRAGLTVKELVPLEQQPHSAVLEQTYSLRVTGAFPNFLRFLHTFEQSECWGDIASVQIRNEVNAGPINTEQQWGQFVLSFYSVPESPAQGDRNPDRQGVE